jgi:GcrA cell cycle regulator
LNYARDENGDSWPAVECAFRPRAYWQVNPNQLSLGKMQNFWTPERDEELRCHAAAGLSASKIAVLLHTTRGAILGRSNRLRGKVFKSDRWLKKQRIAAKKRNSANQRTAY